MGEGSKKKKTNVILICGVVVIIALLVVIIVLLMGNKEEVSEAPESNEVATAEEPRRSVVVTKDTVDDILDDMMQQEYVEPGYYSASMTTEWHFATGDAVSEDAYVQNLRENTNDVYFDVFLAENEEEAIYESPVLPRGSELGGIALDTALSAGTYDCVMVYHLIDEEQNTVSTLRVGFKIIVEG